MRQRRIMVLIALICGLMTACAGQEAVSEEEPAAGTEDTVLAEDAAGTEDTVLAEDAAGLGESTWQEAYVDYLADAPGKEDGGGYSLIYVDDDDIPELMDAGASETDGSRIVSYADGELQRTQLSGLYFTYLEKEGLLCSSGGNMDCCWDLVYRVEDGRVTQVGSGYYGIWQYYDEDRDVELDEEGMPVYLYEWNGEKVTEEEYSEALYSLYDLERAVPGYSYEDPGQGYTADEMTKILENWEG